MKRIVFTLTMIFALGLSLQGVAAQIAPGSGAETDELEGLTSAYSRGFNDETREIQIQAYTYEDEEGAAAFVDLLQDELTVEVEAELSEMGELEFAEMETLDVDGFEMAFTSDEGEFAIKYLAFAKDKTAFAVMVLDTDLESATDLATGIGEHILASEIENEEITFSDDGTSTGGVFDRMPTAHDEIVDEFTGVVDTEIFVAGEE